MARKEDYYVFGFNDGLNGRQKQAYQNKVRRKEYDAGYERGISIRKGWSEENPEIEVVRREFADA